MTTYQALKEVKLLVVVWHVACDKNRWIIWFSKEYCLESNDSIWERSKNFLTEWNL